MKGRPTREKSKAQNRIYIRVRADSRTRVRCGLFLVYHYRDGKVCNALDLGPARTSAETAGRSSERSSFSSRRDSAAIVSRQERRLSRAGDSGENRNGLLRYPHRYVFQIVFVSVGDFNKVAKFARHFQLRSPSCRLPGLLYHPRG